MNGIPAWARIISTIGIPAGIAFFLLGMLSGLVPSPLLTLHRSFIDLASAVNIHAMESTRINTEMIVILRTYTDHHLRLLRQICRNQARDDAALRDCDR